MQFVKSFEAAYHINNNPINNTDDKLAIGAKQQ